MLQGRARLEQWFDSGKLMRPRSCEHGWVDFARAIACHCGVGDIELSKGGQDILNTYIKGAEHLVLVLVDGMGLSQLNQLPEKSFLRKHCKGKLQSVFPASTAPAITTLVTTDYPSQHGITTWWIKLEEDNVVAEVLPFWERFSHKPLEQYGRKAEDVFKRASRFGDFSTTPRTVTCSQFVETAFSRYARSYTSGVGYDDYRSGIDRVIEHVNEREAAGDDGSFTYWYLPQYDKHCHEAGVADKKAWEILTEIDEAIEELAKELDGRARIIITADHGQVDVPRERSPIMSEGTPIMDCLVSFPSGEPSVPVFHVQQGREEEFRRLFEQDYGKIFTLLTSEEAAEMELFGPGELIEEARQRLGTFIALAEEPAALLCQKMGKGVFHFAGIHGGMSAGEMMVPLVVVP